MKRSDIEAICRCRQAEATRIFRAARAANDHDVWLAYGQIMGLWPIVARLTREMAAWRHTPHWEDEFRDTLRFRRRALARIHLLERVREGK